MKIGTLAGVVAIVAVSTVVHAEVILDFDTITPESWVGNSYQSSGVIFDVPGWDVRNETFSGIVLVPSSPNYIRLTEQVSTIRFVDPANPAVPATTTFFEFDNPGLIASWGYYEGLDVVAKDLNGNVVGTASIPFVGPYQARSIFTTTIQAPQIHSVEFTYVPNPWAQGLLPIDNVRFNEVVPAVYATIRPVAGGEVDVCWNSRSNRVYQVQYRSDLTTSLWTDLPPPIPGNGGTNCVIDMIFPGQLQRFYRVVERP